MDQKTLKSAETLINLAFAEDIGDGDITTNNLILPDEKKSAIFLAKGQGVIAGLQVAEMVFRKLDPSLEWTVIKNDGRQIEKGDVIVEFKAGYRALLTGERTALNFVQRMSGIATFSAACAEKVKKTGAKILDTRKTLPGYRLLDKYSVRTGGASNHRMGLFDMVMIKDNHIKVAGSITAAVASIRKDIPVSVKIEVETTNLEQVEEAIRAGADIIMLDNMDTLTMKKAVEMISGKAKTEASGNMTPERLGEVAATGIDYISLGALTHSVKALDISQEIIE